MYQVLDKFFFVFHSSLILLVLFGWLWKRTRKLNLAVILAVAFSWFILGIWYGYGYCPSTDWHWQVRMKLGYHDLPSSYIGFLIDSLTGLEVSERFVDIIAVAFLVLAFLGSSVMNLRDKWSQHLEKRLSNSDFRWMSLAFKLRDLFLPREKVLEEVGIKEGFQVLDFGCGPGSYLIPLSRLVGQTGKVHALDIHPLAMKNVKRLISKKGLSNVQAIHSDCRTSLNSGIIDVALLYDSLHELEDPSCVVEEISRILKPTGILSVSDHHLKEAEIVATVTEGGMFRVEKKGRKTYTFVRLSRAGKNGDTA